jgi:endothelin-converting enzyme
VTSDILFGDPIATYNPAALSNLTEALPQIHFADYFSTFTPRSFPSSIILTDPTFPYSLSTLLSSTANNTIEAYLVTRAALQLAPLLSTESEPWLAVRTLQERLSGIKKGAVGDRAEFCVGKVESSLGFAAGRYFVEEVFGGESKEKGTKIIESAFVFWLNFAIGRWVNAK